MNNTELPTYSLFFLFFAVFAAVFVALAGEENKCEKEHDVHDCKMIYVPVEVEE